VVHLPHSQIGRLLILGLTYRHIKLKTHNKYDTYTITITYNFIHNNFVFFHFLSSDDSSLPSLLNGPTYPPPPPLGNRAAVGIGITNGGNRLPTPTNPNAPHQQQQQGILGGGGGAPPPTGLAASLINGSLGGGRNSSAASIWGIILFILFYIQFSDTKFCVCLGILSRRPKKHLLKAKLQTALSPPISI
jgi:hypothetical protein